MKKLASALAFGLLAMPAFAAPPPLPAPKILVFDQNALLQVSKVGQDMARQIQALGRQAKADLDGRAKSLQAQGTALQQQIAVLSAEAKAAKLKDFEAKQNALQAEAQKKEAAIQYSAMVAQKQVSDKLQPILQQLMNERGANMILSRQAVLMGRDSAAFDITKDVINRLNQQMPGIKVKLVSPPSR